MSTVDKAIIILSLAIGVVTTFAVFGHAVQALQIDALQHRIAELEMTKK